MNIWSIIIAAAIFILPSLLPSKKNAGKKTASAVPPISEGTPTMADLFEDEEDADDYANEYADADSEVYADADDLGQPVFSYETVSESNTFAEGSSVNRKAEVDGSEPKEVFTQSKDSDSMSVMALDEDFDLRKAIVYQTIMQRVCA